MHRPLVLGALLLALDARALELDWVTIAPGGDCDLQSQGCFGAVANAYQISRYEVTNAQYAEFLSAVAKVDPHYLFDPRMGQDDAVGGIRRMGLVGSFVYVAKPGFENEPVVYTTFHDAARFANWMHNGQPTGPQGPATTEDGAYTLTGHTSGGPRKPGAEVFLPSEDEWVRAAYYDADSMTYFEYPTGTDADIECVTPAEDSGNSANCEWFDAEGGGTTPVGAYALSPSPSGTYDQAGNAWEWNDTAINNGHGLRGGSWSSSASVIKASYPRTGFDGGDRLTGFRLARRVPDCINGLDDDGDGSSDLADPGCAGADDLDEHDPTLPCDDGADNDGDGLTDFPGDPVCQTGWYTRENALCQDGLDNDGDGLVDFDGGASYNGGVPLTAADPQCVAKPWQNKEASNGCGLGAELALLLPLLRRAAAQKRRAAGSTAPMP